MYFQRALPSSQTAQDYLTYLARVIKLFCIRRNIRSTLYTEEHGI